MGLTRGCSIHIVSIPRIKTITSTQNFDTWYQKAYRCRRGGCSGRSHDVRRISGKGRRHHPDGEGKLSRHAGGSDAPGKMEAPDPLRAVHPVTDAVWRTEEGAYAHHQRDAHQRAEGAGGRRPCTSGAIQRDSAPRGIHPDPKGPGSASGLLCHLPVGDEVHSLKGKPCIMGMAG